MIVHRNYIVFYREHGCGDNPAREARRQQLP
jgi:hypothetical protein